MLSEYMYCMSLDHEEANKDRGNKFVKEISWEHSKNLKLQMSILIRDNLLKLHY